MKSYLNRLQEEKNNANLIIDDTELLIDVYRTGTLGTRPGFEDSVSGYAKVGTIKARIDRWKGKSFREVIGSMGKAVELIYVGKTTDVVIAVRNEDEWRVGGITYKVTAFDDTTEIIEVLLKRLK